MQPFYVPREILFSATCVMTTNSLLQNITCQKWGKNSLPPTGKKYTWINLTSCILAHLYGNATGTDLYCARAIECCVLWRWEKHTPFVFSPRCTYDIWENVAQGEQLYWEKQSYREEKNNYETVHPFKKLIPEILSKSGVQINPWYKCMQYY